jgi:TctA family transporter
MPVIHFPTLLAALNFFATAVVFRSLLHHVESRYQVAIFVVLAMLVELNARSLFQRSPSITAVLLFIISATLGIIMAKWAIEGIPWWLHRWLL